MINRLLTLNNKSVNTLVAAPALQQFCEHRISYTKNLRTSELLILYKEFVEAFPSVQVCCEHSSGCSPLQTSVNALVAFPAIIEICKCPRNQRVAPNCTKMNLLRFLLPLPLNKKFGGGFSSAIV